MRHVRALCAVALGMSALVGMSCGQVNEPCVDALMATAAHLAREGFDLEGRPGAPTPEDAVVARRRAKLVCDAMLRAPGAPPANKLDAMFKECVDRIPQYPLLADPFRCIQTALVGTLPDVAPCAWGFQCASKRCSIGLQEVCGRCGDSKPASAGEACVGDCAERSTQCVKEGSAQICRAVTGQLDSPCPSDPYVCVPPNVCTRDSTGDDSHCRAPAGVGPHSLLEYCAADLVDDGNQSCVRPSEMGGACANNRFCAAADLRCIAGKCTRPNFVAKPGEPCSSERWCIRGVCGNGMCPRILEDGQPCNTVDPLARCDAWALCVNGICQRMDAANCK